MLRIKTVLVFAVILMIASCRKPEDIHYEDHYDMYSGGAKNTVFDASSFAYSYPLPSLSQAGVERHEKGDRAFASNFVTAPGLINPGLGPVFNNVSCASCHVSDGRGKPPLPGEILTSMLFRISIPGQNPHGGPNPVPGYGGQLQDKSVFGQPAEAKVDIQYMEDVRQFVDGLSYSLRIPTYTIQTPYSSWPSDGMLSPRVAPPVMGLGLLESIPEADILLNADPADQNNDGISGRPNYVWDAVKQQTVLGRFGWKAGAPNLLQQVTGAYNEDMGITNFVFPVESCADQPQYDQLKDDYEVSDEVVRDVTFYCQTLAVPGRRNYKDQEVVLGKTIFAQAQCTSCHLHKMQTAVNVAFPSLSNEVIFPYTDLLLHDMGPELADGRPDFQANGQEWRTPPLWGIGLTRMVNGHSNFLHDGRARTLLEAIMWHGGEGQSSRNYVNNLSEAERNALIKFLESL
jgi:CxxC motif-containing protein (DUF1111 family)